MKRVQLVFGTEAGIVWSFEYHLKENKGVAYCKLGFGEPFADVPDFVFQLQDLLVAHVVEVDFRAVYNTPQNGWYVGEVVLMVLTLQSLSRVAALQKMRGLEAYSA
jgi:hypothetical protein